MKDRLLIDLSHAVEHGMATYPGLPAPAISDYMTREESREHYAPGTEFHIGRIEMVGNTGTYIDAPFHRFAAGKDLAALPLSSMANLPGIVIRAVQRGGRAVEVAALAGRALAGRAVLIHTGWAAHWGTAQYFEGHPFITEEVAQRLADAGAALVGIDMRHGECWQVRNLPYGSLFGMFCFSAAMIWRSAAEKANCASSSNSEVRGPGQAVAWCWSKPHWRCPGALLRARPDRSLSSGVWAGGGVMTGCWPAHER